MLDYHLLIEKIAREVPNRLHFFQQRDHIESLFIVLYQFPEGIFIGLFTSLTSIIKK